MGRPVRYNATSVSFDLSKLKSHFTLVPFCPEVSAGLPTPRPPAEITHSNITDAIMVKQNDGLDVTNAFQLGAKLALAHCQKSHIKLALLTEFSPSCGSTQIYDGTFKGIKQRGQGITAKLLSQHGVKVFNQFQVNDLIELAKKDKDYFSAHY